MEFQYPLTLKNIIINTGNLLSLNDITKKPGQNTTEELVEAVNITLKDFRNTNKINSIEGGHITITRPYEDLASKIAEHEINDLKIGLKVFVENDKEEQLVEALENTFKALNISSVQNVVLSYNNKQSEGQNDVIEKIKNIWKTLEKFVQDKKILQIGLSDVEELVFKTIYEWANIKPSIIQINLASCCVVPPTLQAFCKDNDVQLLTHSDPNDILPEESVQGLFGAQLTLQWVVRFLVHIKCRGVLKTKGYLLSLSNHS